jgi:hypothetical protein
MKAIVLNNPFAAAIFFGKTLETRPRDTQVRGEVLICSARKPYRPIITRGICGPKQYSRLEFALLDEALKDLHGYALGVVTIVGSHKMEEKDEDSSFVAYSPLNPRYCWELDNIRRIEPFAWEFGKQGWLNVPESELGKIKYL